MAATIQPIEQASEIMDKEYDDAVASNEKEKAQYLKGQEDAEKLLKLVCSTFASLG